MRKNVKYFLLLNLIFLFFTACKDKHPQELKMIDTLDLLVDSTEIALNYDLVTLNNRTKRIKFQLHNFNHFNKDTLALETGNKLQKYKEISKIYGQFINNFEDCYNTMKLSEEQSKRLRNSVVDDKLSKEEFKSHYSTELARATINLEKSKRVSKFIPAVEPEFQRLNKEVDVMLHHVAKSDSVLHRILAAEEEL
jgi:hypothetical protein